ncbi:MAG: FeS cluster assembly protein SufB [Chlamydiae bacterium]|nr:FeS cluster assembly protein SufB [Chlamydiota bacterium]
MSARTTEDILKKRSEYQYGFVTEVESESIPKGLTEDTIHQISQKKNEPPFMLEFRLKAYRRWLEQKEPRWANVTFPEIDYQAFSYYSAPKKKPQLGSLDEVDPEVLRTFERLGIPVDEQKQLSNVAVDMVFDSVSVGTTFREQLEKSGVILCSISEAIQKYPDLIKKYLASVVPIGDNFYATLNAAVFTDGSFVYVPKGVR